MLVRKTFVNKPDEIGWYRLGLLVETSILELHVPAPRDRLFTVDELRRLGHQPSQVAPIRLLRQERQLYAALMISLLRLPFGQVESRAIPYQNYRLAFTADLLAPCFWRTGYLMPCWRARGRLCPGVAFFKRSEPVDTWWIGTGRSIHHPERFYLPIAHIDSRGNRFSFEHDAYDLFVKTIVDPLGNTVRVEHNYRTLLPSEWTDANVNLFQIFPRHGRWSGRTALLSRPDGSGEPSYATPSGVNRLDPLGRRIRTDWPDGAFATTVIGPWERLTFDENDNVLQSRWYAASQRPKGGRPGRPSPLP